MRKQRIFRLSWIVPTLIAGFVVLYTMDLFHIKLPRDLGRAVSDGYAALIALLIAAWLLERVYTALVALRRNAQRDGWITAGIDGMTTVTERSAEAVIPVVSTLGRVVGAVANVATGTEEGRRRADANDDYRRQYLQYGLDPLNKY